MTPITAKERKKIEKRSKQRAERLHRKYPEVHGKVRGAAVVNEELAAPPRVPRCD